MTAPPRPTPAFVRRIDRQAGNVIPFPAKRYAPPPVIHPVADDCTGPEFRPAQSLRIAEACTGVGIALTMGGFLTILAAMWWAP